MAEIILALGLATLVIAALMTVYFSAYRVFACQTAFTDIQYAERAAMQMMIEDVMAAEEVECLDDSKTMRLTMDGGYISYYLQDRTVYRQGNAKMPVANDISSLLFQPDSRPGYTCISMEACQGLKTHRLVCAAVPRSLVGAAPAESDK